VSTKAQPYRAPNHGGGAPKKRVLFLCVGNACRSQMAEGFARAYGDDILVAASAGLAPAMSVAADTLRAMDEKNIDLRHHFPKSWRHLANVQFDLVVNLSGNGVPEQIAAPVRTWSVPDPVMLDYKDHCRVRDRIETLVMELILELRRVQKKQRA
jgi:arsenate reductase (thioredoxin)